MKIAYVQFFSEMVPHQNLNMSTAHYCDVIIHLTKCSVDSSFTY